MARYESDSLNAGYCEFLTRADATVNVVIARIVIVLVAALLAGAMLFVTLGTIPVVSFMLLVIIVFMAWFVFQFTKIEYEYTIATGVLTLHKIYGARTRKEVFELKTSDFTKIVPFEKLNTLNAKSVFLACRKSEQNMICILYNTEKSNDNVLVISAPDKTMSCLKFYRRSAFV